MSVTPISDELRSAVIALHGSLCLKCRVQCTWSGPTKLHIDHVIPEAMGGRTILSNLQVLCRTCNLRKGKTIADYRSTVAGMSSVPMDRLLEVGKESGHGVSWFYGGKRATRNRKRVVCHCGGYDSGWLKPHWYSGDYLFLNAYIDHINSGVVGSEAARVAFWEHVRPALAVA